MAEPQGPVHGREVLHVFAVADDVEFVIAKRKGVARAREVRRADACRFVVRVVDALGLVH